MEGRGKHIVGEIRLSQIEIRSRDVSSGDIEEQLWPWLVIHCEIRIGEDSGISSNAWSFGHQNCREWSNEDC